MRKGRGSKERKRERGRERQEKAGEGSEKCDLSGSTAERWNKESSLSASNHLPARRGSLFLLSDSGTS